MNRTHNLPKFVFIVIFLFSGMAWAEFVLDEKVYQQNITSHKNNSRAWHARNDHLIPNYEETKSILQLDQKRDFLSNDIDKDGIVNKIDPSVYDWREPGYQPFGVLEFLSWDHDWNSYKYSQDDLRKVVGLLEGAGVSFVRMDFLWQDIEPENDEFVFDKYDFIVNLLAEKNIRILGVLGYSAPWAADTWNMPAREIGDFLDFVSQVISHYKNRIKYWEIWNEPDSNVYFQPQDDMFTYTNLLKATYTQAKKTDPTCKIVLGGMTRDGFYAIKNIYRNGAKDYFDIINIHPFVNPPDPQDVKKIYTIYNNLERLKVQYGDENKKIWFTEIGCPGLARNTLSKGWWIGSSPSEDGQAKFVYTIYTDVVNLANLEKVFWAYFRDNKGYFKNDVDYFGLIRWDFSPKKAYNVFKDRYIHWFNLNYYLTINKKYAR